MFGGQSAEHDVSIITGIQVIEHMDRQRYAPLPVYISKKGELFLIKGLKTRKDFFTAKKSPITWGTDDKGGYIATVGLFSKKYHPYAAYTAFHGGKGESGQIQGLLETLSIPYTSPSTESSAVCMNKRLTKDVLRCADIPTVEGLYYGEADIKNDVKGAVARITDKLGLPVIIKPAHLGSSIGIKIAKTMMDLELGLLEAAHIDSEIVVERFLSPIRELNCSVRYVNDTIKTSEIERPITAEEVLSFDEKYKRGGKKTGGAGMASLSRELPAKVDKAIVDRVSDLAKRAFVACGCKGVVRIDFILTSDDNVFLNEINPIPGSMSFYLWEASGVTFKQQITDVIEQSVVEERKGNSMALDYSTDIVKKFIEG